MCFPIKDQLTKSICLENTLCGVFFHSPNIFFRVCFRFYYALIKNMERFNINMAPKHLHTNWNMKYEIEIQYITLKNL